MYLKNKIKLLLLVSWKAHVLSKGSRAKIFPFEELPHVGLYWKEFYTYSIYLLPPPRPPSSCWKSVRRKRPNLHVEPRAIFQTWKTGQGNGIFVCGFLRGMNFASLLRNGKFWRDWVMD
jgi:hypothetical protein